MAETLRFLGSCSMTKRTTKAGCAGNENRKLGIGLTRQIEVISFARVSLVSRSNEIISGNGFSSLA